MKEPKIRVNRNTFQKTRINYPLLVLLGLLAVLQTTKTAQKPGELSINQRTKLTGIHMLRDGDQRPPSASGDNRPPSASGDNRPPSASGDNRPPSASGDENGSPSPEPQPDPNEKIYRDPNMIRIRTRDRKESLWLNTTNASKSTLFTPVVNNLAEQNGNTRTLSFNFLRYLKKEELPQGCLIKYNEAEVKPVANFALQHGRDCLFGDLNQVIEIIQKDAFGFEGIAIKAGCFPYHIKECLVVMLRHDDAVGDKPEVRLLAHPDSKDIITLLMLKNDLNITHNDIIEDKQDFKIVVKSVRKNATVLIDVTSTLALRPVIDQPVPSLLKEDAKPDDGKDKDKNTADQKKETPFKYSLKVYGYLKPDELPKVAGCENKGNSLLSQKLNYMIGNEDQCSYGSLRQVSNIVVRNITRKVLPPNSAESGGSKNSSASSTGNGTGLADGSSARNSSANSTGNNTAGNSTGNSSTNSSSNSSSTGSGNGTATGQGTGHDTANSGSSGDPATKIDSLVTIYLNTFSGTKDHVLTLNLFPLDYTGIDYKVQTIHPKEDGQPTKLIENQIFATMDINQDFKLEISWRDRNMAFSIGVILLMIPGIGILFFRRECKIRGFYWMQFGVNFYLISQLMLSIVDWLELEGLWFAQILLIGLSMMAALLGAQNRRGWVVLAWQLYGVFDYFLMACLMEKGPTVFYSLINFVLFFVMAGGYKYIMPETMNHEILVSLVASLTFLNLLGNIWFFTTFFNRLVFMFFNYEIHDYDPFKFYIYYGGFFNLMGLVRLYFNEVLSWNAEAARSSQRLPELYVKNHGISDISIDQGLEGIQEYIESEELGEKEDFTDFGKAGRELDHGQELDDAQGGAGYEDDGKDPKQVGLLEDEVEDDGSSDDSVEGGEGADPLG